MILRWFVDFYPNMRKMSADGKEYAWLSHKKLQEDLPILDITKRSCIDRMQKLVEFEILEYKCLKDGGTFSLYRFGKNYEALVSSNAEGMQSTAYGCATETAQGMQSNNIGVCSQTTNKDISIKDSSVIQNNNIGAKRFFPPTVEEVSAYCKERNNNIDPVQFVDYYSSKGWVVGKSKMKDWKASVRTWERNNFSRGTNSANGNTEVINGVEYLKKNGKYYLPGGSGVAVDPFAVDDMPFFK